MATYEQQRKALLDRNMQWAKKDWKATTFKSDEEEIQFLNWVHKNNVPFDPNDPHPDYDMRGFYKALQSGDKRATTAIDPHDKKIHYPDWWKTPYHETFSADSQWASKGAPKWNEHDQLVTPKGQILFSPTESN
jgi:hypothetical protein